MGKFMQQKVGFMFNAWREPTVLHAAVTVEVKMSVPCADHL
jgi:hypothetical protein